MADRSIIFSAPMVRALLAGRKTQTRRLVSPSPRQRRFGCVPGMAFCPTAEIAGEWIACTHPKGGPFTCIRLPFAAGDRLFVREAHRLTACPCQEACRGPGHVYYEADGDGYQPVFRERLRPSIHMPRWASRLTLIVEGVKLEPVQAIGTADVLAEGAPLDPHHRDGTQDGSNPHMCVGERPWTSQSPHAWFHRLWDSLHDKPGERWADNPHVVALTFRVERCNIDKVEKAA